MNYKLYVMCSNSYIICKTFFSLKDDRIVLFGGWMGTKLRFLFQYLLEPEDEAELNHIIWATSSKEVAI